MIFLRNQHLEVSINPGLGGRIDDLVDLSTGDHWVWHPESAPAGEEKSRDLGLDAVFDAHWSGGFEEVFPNDAPGHFKGLELADHGELWRRPWTVHAANGVSALLSFDCRTMPLRVVKSFEVGDDSRLMVSYYLRNLSDAEFPYLLKLHPALRIEPGDRFLFPRAKTRPVAMGFSRRAGRDEECPYPVVKDADGREVPIDETLPRQSESREFLYVTELEAGWCGVQRGRTGSSLKISFSREDFPCVWMFQSFGGFEGHYVAMLEPATGKPYDLEESMRLGECALLGPHGSKRLRVAYEVSEPPVRLPA